MPSQAQIKRAMQQEIKQILMPELQKVQDEINRAFAKFNQRLTMIEQHLAALERQQQQP